MVGHSTGSGCIGVSGGVGVGRNCGQRVAGIYVSFYELKKTFDNTYELLMNTPDSGRPMLVALGDSYMYYALYPEVLKSGLQRHGVNVDVLNLASQATNVTEHAAFTQLAAKRFKHPVILLGVSFQNSNVGSVKDPSLPIGKTVINLNHRPPNFVTRCVTSPGGTQSLADLVYCSAGHVSAFVRLLPAITDLLIPNPDTIMEEAEQRRLFKIESWEYAQMSPLGGGLQEFRPASLKALIYHMVQPEYIMYYAAFKGVDVRMDWAYLPFQSSNVHSTQPTPPVVFLFLPMLDSLFDDFAIAPNQESTVTVDQKAHCLAHQRGWHYQDCHNVLPDISLFKDHTHLNAAGSLYFSDWLADHLQLPDRPSLHAARLQTTQRRKEP